MNRTSTDKDNPRIVNSIAEETDIQSDFLPVEDPYSIIEQGLKFYRNGIIPSFDQDGSLICLKTKNEYKTTCFNKIIAIGDRACVGTRLNKVHGEDVMKIGEDAFTGSTVREVSFPTLHEMGEGAFASCHQLTRVIIGNVTVISERAFSYTDIRSINIPITVEEIKKDSFKGCKHLYAIFVNSLDLENLGSKPSEHELYIHPEAFTGCKKNITIYYPKLITISNKEELIALGIKLKED